MPDTSKKTVKVYEDDWKWLNNRKLDEGHSSLAETVSKIRDQLSEKGNEKGPGDRPE